MKKNILKSLPGLLFTAFLMISCQDFLDVNTNPNDPSESTPGLTLPVAQENLATLHANEMTYLGQFFAYNWATPSNWSANQNLTTYNVTANFFPVIFEDSYGVIFRDLTYVEEYEEGDDASDYTPFQAIALILKAFQYQYLVDLYGDVPYTEANMRAENSTPAYDNAEDVYMSLLNDLSTAVDIISNIQEGAQNPGGQDIMFGGDMEKWAQFANTIKLRMLLRMSDGGFDSVINQEVSNINSNGYGYITETVVTQPGYTDDEGKQNPFWGYIGYNPGSSTEYNRHDYTVASDYSIEHLKSTNDMRMTRIFAPSEVNDDYKGVWQSTDLPSDGVRSDQTSKVGDGLLVSPDQDQPIMLLGEALLIQAEMAQKGYISGSAQSLYESAIEASFVHLGLTTGDAQDYYSQPIENVSWASSSNKLEAIQWQKRVALNGTSSIELWIEHTRTGIPENLPFPDDVTDGRRPVSLLYPSTEIGRNSENVPSQSQDNAFTNNPFWKQ